MNKKNIFHVTGSCKFKKLPKILTIEERKFVAFRFFKNKKISFRKK